MKNWKSLTHVLVTAVLGCLVAFMGLEGEEAAEIEQGGECIEFLLLDIDTAENWGEILENEACKAVIENAAQNLAAYYQAQQEPEPVEGAPEDEPEPVEGAPEEADDEEEP